MKPSLNWLLIFVPAALVLRFWPGLSNPAALFICSAIAIIPVAGWIGHATEALAARVGEGLGGLLNATFGKRGRVDHRRYRALQGPYRGGQGVDPQHPGTRLIVSW